MFKPLAFLFSLVIGSTLYSQLDSTTTTTVDFHLVDKKSLHDVTGSLSFNPDTCFKFDFSIIDSAFYHSNSNKTDLYREPGYEKYQLYMNDRKRIYNFDCEGKDGSECYTYLGFSQNVELHVAQYCHRVCMSMIIDAQDGSTYIVPDHFDGGSTVLFSGNTMLSYGSANGYESETYYGHRSVIDIYNVHYLGLLKERISFKGRITSKYWSVAEMFEWNQSGNTFLMKIYTKEGEYSYLLLDIELN